MEQHSPGGGNPFVSGQNVSSGSPSSCRLGHSPSDQGLTMMAELKESVTTQQQQQQQQHQAQAQSQPQPQPQQPQQHRLPGGFLALASPDQQHQHHNHRRPSLAERRRARLFQSIRTDMLGPYVPASGQAGFASQFTPGQAVYSRQALANSMGQLESPSAYWPSNGQHSQVCALLGPNSTSSNPALSPSPGSSSFGSVASLTGRHKLATGTSAAATVSPSSVQHSPEFGIAGGLVKPPATTLPPIGHGRRNSQAGEEHKSQAKWSRRVSFDGGYIRISASMVEEIIKWRYSMAIVLVAMLYAIFAFGSVMLSSRSSSEVSQELLLAMAMRQRHRNEWTQEMIAAWHRDRPLKLAKSSVSPAPKIVDHHKQPLLSFNSSTKIHQRLVRIRECRLKPHLRSTSVAPKLNSTSPLASGLDNATSATIPNAPSGTKTGSDPRTIANSTLATRTKRKFEALNGCLFRHSATSESIGDVCCCAGAPRYVKQPLPVPATNVSLSSMSSMNETISKPSQIAINSSIVPGEQQQPQQHTLLSTWPSRRVYLRPQIMCFTTSSGADLNSLKVVAPLANEMQLMNVFARDKCITCSCCQDHEPERVNRLLMNVPMPSERRPKLTRLIASHVPESPVGFWVRMQRLYRAMMRRLDDLFFHLYDALDLWVWAARYGELPQVIGDHTQLLLVHTSLLRANGESQMVTVGQPVKQQSTTEAPSLWIDEDSYYDFTTTTSTTSAPTSASSKSTTTSSGSTTSSTSTTPTPSTSTSTSAPTSSSTTTTTTTTSTTSTTSTTTSTTTTTTTPSAAPSTTSKIIPSSSSSTTTEPPRPDPTMNISLEAATNSAHGPLNGVPVVTSPKSATSSPTTSKRPTRRRRKNKRLQAASPAPESGPTLSPEGSSTTTSKSPTLVINVFAPSAGAQNSSLATMIPILANAGIAPLTVLASAPTLTPRVLSDGLAPSGAKTSTGSNIQLHINLETAPGGQTSVNSSTTSGLLTDVSPGYLSQGSSVTITSDGLVSSAASGVSDAARLAPTIQLTTATLNGQPEAAAAAAAAESTSGPTLGSEGSLATVQTNNKLVVSSATMPDEHYGPTGHDNKEPTLVISMDRSQPASLNTEAKMNATHLASQPATGTNGGGAGGPMVAGLRPLMEPPDDWPLEAVMPPTGQQQSTRLGQPIMQIPPAAGTKSSAKMEEPFFSPLLAGGPPAGEQPPLAQSMGQLLAHDASN